MRDPDQQFFDSFMLVVGILIGVTVGLFLLVQRISSDTQGQYVLEDPTVLAEIDRRIEPVGSVLLMGSDELAAAATEPVATPERVEAPLSGPQVYNEACVACHGMGLAGAPIAGDAAAWEGRLEQGMETLTEHVISGYQGEAGYMPPKGGRPDLSDDEVVAGLQYMLDMLEQ